MFYVYEHWRPDTKTCFYVGKGHGRRSHDMCRGRNRHHRFVQKKLKEAGLHIDVRVVYLAFDEAAALHAEMELIKFWRAAGAKLVNYTDGGDGTTGLKHTDEWKKAASERMKTRIISAETRAKISAAHKGHKYNLGKRRSLEAIAKTSAANRGLKRSPEYCAKLSIRMKENPPWTAGRKHPPDVIEKIRNKQIGIPKSEETRARMRKPKSESHKAKLRAANLGKTHNSETKSLLSEIGKRDWIMRKAMNAELEM